MPSTRLEGQIGFRSDDDEAVLGPGGYITKPRGQTHAMWNAGKVPGRIAEVITPGLRELSPRAQLAASEADGPAEPGAHQHESDALATLAEKIPPDLRKPAVARRCGGPLRPESASPLTGN